VPRLRPEIVFQPVEFGLRKELLLGLPPIGDFATDRIGFNASSTGLLQRQPSEGCRHPGPGSMTGNQKNNNLCRSESLAKAGGPNAVEM
jgi:hypothetical protein